MRVWSALAQGIAGPTAHLTGPLLSTAMGLLGFIRGTPQTIPEGALSCGERDRQHQASTACHDVSSQLNCLTVTSQSAWTAALNFRCHRS
jgi:hypothetical protein